MAADRFSPNARRVLERRYLLRQEGRPLETPDQLLRRVARAVARAELAHGGEAASARWQEAFYEAMARLEFLPNSPTLMNAGREEGERLGGGQLSACFVLPVGDSMLEIFDAVKWAALIQKTGGGTGFSFSRLRPAGDPVRSTQGIASGPLAFLEVFNAATDAIRQGGVRRGANMGVLRVDHPDVRAFIAVKRDPARLRNFNVSVAVSDAFMSALAAGTSYALVSPRTAKEVGRLEARQLWQEIAEAAWHGGEPGLLFIDRIEADNPTPLLGSLESTNPCGELPLLPFEACNLGSVDVGKLVANGAFDWGRLARLVELGVRFLDDVIDVNHYPLPQIAAVTRGNRKIGLGVMGFADALIALGVAYDSEAAVAFAGELAGFIAARAQAATVALAEERGPFTGWEGSRWQALGRLPRRNATTTAIAPTGTLSILAGAAAGIEPLYAVSFVRQVLDGERLVEVQPRFVQLAKEGGFYSEALIAAVAARGSVRGMAAVPESVQRLFATAYDVEPRWHLEMQAAFQRHVHNAVSKTINFPRSASVADIAAAYETAYRLGCKGITVYRDGCRDDQVLRFGAPAGAACPDCL